MPLPEDTGGVSSIGKIIGHGRVLGPKQGPSAAHVDRTVAGRIQTGKQLPAGRRAHGRYVIIGKTYALSMQTIQAGGLQDRIAMGRDFGIALIIGHYDDHVRALTCQDGKGGE